jgi:hypothetical protein
MQIIINFEQFLNMINSAIEQKEYVFKNLLNVTLNWDF